MSARVFEVRDRRTGRAARLRTAAGRIVSVDTENTAGTGRPLLLPALVDIQVNGYAGIDFQRDTCTAAELHRAADGLVAAACGRFLLTLITDHWPRLLARLRHYRQLRLASPVLRQRIAGWHLEGPFLNPKPGFHGAHPPECMEAPTAAHWTALKAEVGDEPVLLTIAPEWPGAPAAIRAARAHGFHVWLGHSDATATELAAAVEAGAAGFTHLGNGCPGELHRHDNIIFRVLDETRLRASLIPDGIHVSPVLFRLLHRLLPDDQIAYTTDAMAAAGAGPGTYDLAGLRVEVGVDGIVRQPGKSNYAGSSLAPLDGIRRAAAMLRRAPHEVWRYFADHPARFVGLGDGLASGDPAEFCLLHEEPDAWRIDLHFTDQPVREVRWPKAPR
jgi:N-acetylglucosamine-6-phosphate deacetylase